MNRANLRIMIVDDEPFILKLHAHMLTKLGLTFVDSFEAGQPALDDIDRGKIPHLILLDLSMPGMDGIEFIRHLVLRDFKGSLVLVSGEDERLLQSAERLVRAHGINVLGHLSKPVKPIAFRGLLETWESQSADAPRRAWKTYTADEIRRGLSEREFVGHFQPQVRIKTGEVVGVEALARWHHPTDGIVPPARFMEVIERHGMVDELTKLIFTQSTKEIHDLAKDGLPLQVSINVSPTSLNTVSLADFLAAEAARLEMPAQHITLEVTETQAVTDQRAPLDVLTRLRLMRFRLSIDDFGTGYSSLTQLRELPFDELKIDQTFVHRAASDSTARAIYEASLGLAKQLKLRTVAEGVEDRADWDFVRSTECDVAQGYFIGRPMPPEALRGWAESWRDRMVSGFV